MTWTDTDPGGVIWETQRCVTREDDAHARDLGALVAYHLVFRELHEHGVPQDVIVRRAVENLEEGEPADHFCQRHDLFLGTLPRGGIHDLPVQRVYLLGHPEPRHEVSSGKR